MKCKSCGEANPADAINCQKCGTPLAINKQEYVLGTRMSTQDQPELPAWLESLRAGERPASPPASPSSFSAADLVDGGSLPNWMRPERGDISDPGLSGPQHAVRSSTFSAPNTDGGFAPPQSISAGSLIDEQSLPMWMQPEQPQTNISAASLVQPDDMPDWMKAMQPQSQTPPQTQPFQQAQNWSAPTSSAAPHNPQNQRPLPAQGFSARDLIDDQAMPEWMLQGQGSAGPSVPGGGMPGQASFAASSLIDKDVLPDWMRERGQGPSANPPPSTFAQQPAQPFNNATWQGPAQTPPLSGAPNAFPQSGASGQGERFSASSFIDPNVLPEWLRNAGEQGGRQAGTQGRPGTYGVPPRVENVRVPNRPRAEMGPVEGSEEAANVFASMLGVAANAPKFPTHSEQMPPAMYGQPGEQGPSQGRPGQTANTPRSYTGTGPQPTPGYSGMGMGAQQQGYPGTGPQQTPGYSGMGMGGQSQGYPGTGPQPPQQQQQGYAGAGSQYPSGGYNSGYIGNMGNAGNLGVGQGNYGTGIPPAQNPGASMGNPSMYQGQGGPDTMGTQEKPAKRGLFEAIRSLFFR